MGFLSHVRQDLQESLAEQQRLAVIAVLRKRFSTLTFDDLRQLLTSPLGKGLGSQRIADLLTAPTAGVAGRSPAKSKTSNKKTPAVKKPKRQKSTAPRRAGTMKTSGEASKPVEPGEAQPVTDRPPRRASKLGKKTGSRKKERATGGTPAPQGSAVRVDRGADRRPPGLSAEQTAEMTRYGEAVLAFVRQTGDWVGATEIREHVGKSAEQLRLALRKLEASGDIVRTGERGHTRYKTAAR